MGQDIDGLGYLDDATDEISSWSTMIVPIRVGGGTRVKIAEAFSRRCPVVSTTLGAFGYEVTDGVELVLADNSESFANACVRLINDRVLATKLSDTAWTRFLREWTWDSIGGSVEEVVRMCIDSASLDGKRKSSG